MRIAVIGSAGYLGTALVTPLQRANHTLLLVDAGLWGDPPAGTVVCHSGLDILRHLRAFKPESVVWLGALAHDPQGKFDSHLVMENNADLPAAVAQWALRAGVRFIAISSYSVFAGPNCGAYPASKRDLEDQLCDLSLWRGASFVRFGTLFGVTEDTTVSSFRPHLLLNSFMLDALAEGKVYVDDTPRRRPVTPLQWAVSTLIQIVEDPVGGTAENIHLCSGTLKEYAQLIADDTGAKVCTRPAPVQDARDYFFPPALDNNVVQESLKYELPCLRKFVDENLAGLIKRRDGCWAEYYRRVGEMRLST